MTEPSATLKVAGPATEDNSVPVDVLVRALSGLQQTVLLLAASKEQKQIKERFKPEADLRQKHTLRCGVPRAGSYALDLSIADELPSRGFLDESERTSLSDVLDLVGAVATVDFARLSVAVPDSIFRNRILGELKKMLPKVDDRWFLELSSPQFPAVSLTNESFKVVGEWLARRTAPETVITIKGTLASVDFFERKLSLIYPPTKHEIACTYLDDVEDTILRSRRALIEVEGKFTLDDNGNPKRLTDVTRIEAVDLRPMTLGKLSTAFATFTFTPPLVLEVTLDETKQLYVAEEPSIGISAFSESREELNDEIAEQVAMLWTEYAAVDANELDSAAQKLQREITSRVTR